MNADAFGHDATDHLGDSAIRPIEPRRHAAFVGLLWLVRSEPQRGKRRPRAAQSGV